jgi:hypothetical protein
MTITLPTLLSFTGDRLDLNIRFLPAILQAARIASTTPRQILYEIMTPAQRIAEFNAEAHVPLIQPPPAPPADCNERAYDLWKEDKKLYKEYRAEESNFHTWVVNGLNENVQLALSINRPYGSMSVGEILQALRGMYGEIQSSDLQIQLNKMKMPLEITQERQDFIAVHVRGHYVHTMAQAPMSEIAKVQIMQAAMAACPAYESCVTMYNHDFPLTTDQTFDRLTNALRNFSIPSQFLTTRALNAAVSVPLGNKSNHSIKPAHANRGTTKPTPANKPMEPPTSYCWTHGICFHHGKNCRTPEAGHQPDAKMDTKMGGCTDKTRPRKIRPDRPAATNGEKH